MKKIAGLLILLAGLFACHQAVPKSNVAEDSLQKLIGDTSVKFVVATPKEGNVPVVYYLQFDSSKTVRQNLYKGWMDTFSIDKQQFRLLLDTSLIPEDHDDFCVEQYRNKHWEKLFNFFLGQDDYGRFDINNDGYEDFVKFYHDRHYVYRYDPVKKTISSDLFVMPGDVTVLDEGHNILCDYYDAMYGEPYQSSTLYTYRNGIPFPFYQLQLIEGNRATLYSFKKGKWEDSAVVKYVKLERPKLLNYKSYWKENYQQLMKKM